jgi:hypothetical protein
MVALRPALCALDPPLHRGNAQLVIFPSQDDFISRTDSKRFAVVGRDNDSSVLINDLPGFACHVMLPIT